MRLWMVIPLVLLMAGIGVAELPAGIESTRCLAPAGSGLAKPGAQRFSSAVDSAQYRWTKGVIPYVVDGSVPYADRVSGAVERWNAAANGHVVLVPRTAERNYVRFVRGTGCLAAIGMTGGEQLIQLDETCGVSTILHEIGHTAGLYHEHTRFDRDSFVRVLWENVEPGKAYAFNIESEGIDLGRYDFASIMHYPAGAFSLSGAPTLETIPRGVPIGSAEDLSAGDIEALKYLYPSPAIAAVPALRITSNPSGIPVEVDGIRTITPRVEFVAPGDHVVSAPERADTPYSRRTFVFWSDRGSATHHVNIKGQTNTLTATYAVENRIGIATSGAGAVVPEAAELLLPAGSLLALKAVPHPGSCLQRWTMTAMEGPAKGMIGQEPRFLTLRITPPHPLEIQAHFVPSTAVLEMNQLTVPADFEGEISVGVQEREDCVWSADSEVAWVTPVLFTTDAGAVSAGSSLDRKAAPELLGTGSGRVTLLLSANRSGEARSTEMRVAGQPLRIYQEGRIKTRSTTPGGQTVD